MVKKSLINQTLIIIVVCNSMAAKNKEVKILFAERELSDDRIFHI